MSPGGPCVKEQASDSRERWVWGQRNLKSVQILLSGKALFFLNAAAGGIWLWAPPCKLQGPRQCSPGGAVLCPGAGLEVVCPSAGKYCEHVPAAGGRISELRSTLSSHETRGFWRGSNTHWMLQKCQHLRH